MCGIITASDAYARYRRAVACPLDRRQFDLVLSEFESCDTRDDYALWRHQGTDYIISTELSDKSAPARVTRTHFADRIVDGAGFGFADDATLVGLEEQDMGTFDRLVAQTEAELEQLRLSLLRLDRHLAPHELPADMLLHAPIEALVRIDALRALRDFVDAHIPDGEDDYTLAECFVRSIVISAVLLSDS
jgi:hypothetical protein